MKEVHLSEGMLLLPQHLQAMTRNLTGAIQGAVLSAGPSRWGVRSLELRVTSEKVGVHSADVVLEDGTEIRSGEAQIPSIPLGDELHRSRGRLPVWLGVPEIKAETSVIADDDRPHGRYTLRSEQVQDENVEGEDGVRPIEMRMLNARLFLGDQDRAGYTAIQVAELQRKNELDPEPVVSTDYVPPLFDVTADASIKKCLVDLCDGLRTANEQLGADAASNPYLWAIKTGEDAELIFKLNVTNTLYPVVRQLCLTQGVHPFDTYAALGQLAGSLSSFSPERCCPDLPAYDHKNLGECFRRVSDVIQGFLAITVRRTFEVTPFTPNGAPGRLECKLARDWLDDGSRLYVGVQTSALSGDELDARMGPDIKFFGEDDLSAVEPHALSGVHMRREVRVPPALPSLADVYYYRIDRDTTPVRRWSAMCSSRRAVLLSESRSLPDAEFGLYVVSSR